jgi:hypothetical protein
MNIHLSRSQTNAGRSVHRLGHIGNDLAHTIVNDSNRLCYLVQSGIGVMENG